MTEHGVTESVVEEAALAWLESTGWRIAHGPDIALNTPAAEWACRGEEILGARVPDARLPKLISGNLRLPAALCDRAAQAGARDAEAFLKERGL